mmetsp:Transcript_102781/g.265700  ORF Transcript_102781/g.265700 Transcript_102781/m.265700 type:complete len:324 (+) Transcript_102781:89-1060(+)
MSPSPLPASASSAGEEVHEVWDWNLEKEFANLTSAASPENSVLALDVEFPGFLRQEPRSGARAVRYQVLRENVDRLRPIQIGISVAGSDGSLKGTWSFNLQFDVASDLHTEKAIAFLRAAGLDFPRHKMEGITAEALGKLLADSNLVGQHSRAPWWVTFAGFYDLGYLLKLLTLNAALPQNFGAFEINLSTYCPRRHELRDELPHGSLDSLARRYGLPRRGSAHTAGSDALLTLELFLSLLGNKCEVQDHWWNPWVNEDSWVDGMQQHSMWPSAWPQMTNIAEAANWDATIPWEASVAAAGWDHAIVQAAVQVQQTNMPIAPR